MKELLRRALYWFYRLLPKRNWACVFGLPDFEDSALELERALAKTSVEKIILLVGKRDSVPPCTLSSKTKVAVKFSLSGFLYFTFSRMFFFTHRCYMREFPPNVLSVNVWHGMPIKRIGKTL